ncbi:MAG: hypothetical protein ACRCRP_02360 [Metamycoplasmataceae bacterium]
MNNLELIIKKTSISIAPDYDSFKLATTKQFPIQPYKENKIIFKDVYKIKQQIKSNNKKILKNIKSNSFSINIEFNSNSSDFKNFYFNIIFSKSKLEKIYTCFHFNRYIQLDENTLKDIEKYFIWLKIAFNINKIYEKMDKLPSNNWNKVKIEKIINNIDKNNEI